MLKRLQAAVMLSLASKPYRSGILQSIPEDPEDYIERNGCERIITAEIIAEKYGREPEAASEKIIKECYNSGISIITFWQDEYPLMLREIPKPPLVLYYSGKPVTSRMVSIVGTRRSDRKSESITRRISEITVSAGYTVVSGMASGIDRNAHLGALQAGGGTLAVLPGGVDIVYPVSNRDIYALIKKSKCSAVVSEYPPGIGSGEKWTFARRNRIISGLSEKVVLVQAPLKSGAMITARHAIEQNRELLVCPGNAFDSNYEGCHFLIREGAQLFSSINDLFPDNGVKIEINDTRQTIKKKNFSKNETKKIDIFTYNNYVPADNVEECILHLLGRDNFIIDDFIRNNIFSVEDVNTAIINLEIMGITERRGNRLYKKRII